jgi:hypothetical protein
VFSNYDLIYEGTAHFVESNSFGFTCDVTLPASLTFGDSRPEFTIGWPQDDCAFAGVRFDMETITATSFDVENAASNLSSSRFLPRRLAP